MNINYVFTLPTSWDPVGCSYREPYPVGTPWSKVREDWETPGQWGPLIEIGLEFPKWTDMGGYPIHYITKDGGVLSSKSANENLEQCIGDDPQWQIIAAEINYEDPDLYCDHSGERIESAYAVDEVEDEEVVPE
jgi:hypothetical protein